jgi:acid phosphatase type 7
MRGSGAGFAHPIAVAAFGVVLVLAGVYAEVAAAQRATQRFAPNADAFVNRVFPNRNFGGGERLRTDAAPLVRAYVLFDVRGLNGRVDRAWLRFTTLRRSSHGFRLHPVSNTTWRERRITYANAPTVQTQIARSGPFGAGKRISLNVTRRVRGNGTVAFALTTRSPSSIPLASRESPTIIEPKLVVRTVVPELPAGSDPVLVGAGDIATCYRKTDEATAALLDWIPGLVFTVGDNVYPEGTADQFRRCYDTSWGRHKARTRPTVGNHEYLTPGAAGYFGYFGASAGDPASGYYSYDMGAWHVIALNSNCAAVGGCERGSPQEQWLRADLAAHPAACTLAYAHHPRFTSGGQGNLTLVPFWDALYEHGADVFLAGHKHHYERFAPLTPTGEPDALNGIREFIIGTGGKSHNDILEPSPNTEAVEDATFGVLKLTLHPSSYDWQFVPVAGATFTDSGSADCH